MARVRAQGVAPGTEHPNGPKASPRLRRRIDRPDEDRLQGRLGDPHRRHVPDYAEAFRPGRPRRSAPWTTPTCAISSPTCTACARKSSAGSSDRGPRGLTPDQPDDPLAWPDALQPRGGTRRGGRCPSGPTGPRGRSSGCTRPRPDRCRGCSELARRLREEDGYAVLLTSPTAACPAGAATIEAPPPPDTRRPRPRRFWITGGPISRCSPRASCAPTC